jgi:hypothetical protein
MVIDFAVLGAIVSVVGLSFHLIQKSLNAILAIERDLNRLSANLQKVAIRLSNVEKYLERKTEFIGSALDTGITEDRFL